MAKRRNNPAEPKKRTRNSGQPEVTTPDGDDGLLTDVSSYAWTVRLSPDVIVKFKDAETGKVRRIQASGVSIQVDKKDRIVATQHNDTHEVIFWHVPDENRPPQTEEDE